MKKRGLNEPALAMADGGLGCAGRTVESVEAIQLFRAAVLATHDAEYPGQIAELPLAHLEAVQRLCGIYSATGRGGGGKFAQGIVK